MAKKYQILYADPPWKHLGRYRSKSKTRDSIHYARMSLKDICSLPMSKITSNKAVLFLWVTDGKLDEGIEVVKAWGFKYITVAFVWLKLTSTGKIVRIVSPWFIKSTELCLFAVKGKPHNLLKTKNTKQLIISPRSTHSTKPNQVRKRIERMFNPNLNKIELFARKKYPGWDVWGNEVRCDIRL